jgi:L,D-transpeptidase catalytic domain
MLRTGDDVLDTARQCQIVAPCRIERLTWISAALSLTVTRSNSKRVFAMRRASPFGRLVVLLGLVAAVGVGSADVARATPSLVSLPAAKGYARGTVIIVNAERKLYYVLGDGRAIVYPVAVGKSDELWIGRTFVSAKKENPKWIPDDDREPVEGGEPGNPLGKRAIYLDWSLLRIHGTPSRGSIGSSASAGCIRMFDEDVIDLYERVHLGAPVIAIDQLADAGRFVAKKFTGKLESTD